MWQARRHGRLPGGREIHDLADREGDYAFFKQAFGAWPIASDRMARFDEIDLLSAAAELL